MSTGTTPFSLRRILDAYGKNRILIDSIGRDKTQSNIAFSWLLLLRWGALVCQILLVVAVYFFFKTITPLPIPLLIIAFAGGSNLVFHFFYQKRHKNIPGSLFALVMFLDIILLTALLHWTGGAMNPFTFLFLIHISLGAILMRPVWAWSMAVFTTLCYAILFFLPEWSPMHTLRNAKPLISCQSGVPTGSTMTDGMELHLQGMWLAFAITVFFVVFFVNKIQMSLENHQKTVTALELEKSKSEKLASLATLSAGAAHEFSTPLATIAIAAGEMLTTLKNQSSDPELVNDTMLIRDQVERCREILYQMSADAGKHLAESLRIFTIDDLCTEVLSWFSDHDRARIEVDCTIRDFTIRMPFRTLKRIIRGLIKNALDASEPEVPVQVSCWKDERFLYFEVRDRGKGMDEQTLNRAIEPFYTTKQPGKGLGLGLFLAQSAAERLGGNLMLSSIPGEGTVAHISFALSHIHSR